MRRKEKFSMRGSVRVVFLMLVLNLLSLSAQTPEPPALIPYRKGDKWGFCDRNKNIIIECKYDEVDFFSEGLAAVKINDKWAYIDSNGNEVIPAIYKIAYSFSEGFAAVKETLDYYYSYIDTQGKKVIIGDYEVAHSFENGYAVTKINHKWGLIDKKGMAVIPHDYDDFYFVTDTIIYVKKNNKCGLLSVNNREIIPVKYDFLMRLINNMFRARIDNKWKLVEVSGKEITPLKYDFIDYKASNNMVLVKFENGRLGFIDFDGNEYWEGGNDGIYKNYVNKIPELIPYFDGSKWGFVDRNRNIVISCQYDEVNFFSENLASVKLDNKWGFIDKSGSVVVPFNYYHASDFKEGIAFVENYKYGLINKNGEKVIDFIYDKVKSFDGRIAIVKKIDKWGCINAQGKEIIPFIYEEITFMPEINLFYVKLTGSGMALYGFLDSSGKEKIPVKYHNFYYSSIKNNLLYAEYNRKLGYIDLNGNEYWEDYVELAKNNPKSDKFYADIEKIDSYFSPLGFRYSYENAQKANIVKKLCDEIIKNTNHPYKAEAYVRRAFANLLIAMYTADISKRLTDAAKKYLDEAYRDVSIAIELKPNMPESYLVRGFIKEAYGYSGENDFKKARELGFEFNK